MLIIFAISVLCPSATCCACWIFQAGDHYKTVKATRALRHRQRARAMAVHEHRLGVHDTPTGKHAFQP